MRCISRKNTFSVGLDAAAVAFEDATTALKVLFGLLFMSLAEEEGAEILLQPLLALLIATAVSDDADTVICLPGEAIMRLFSSSFERQNTNVEVFVVINKKKYIRIFDVITAL